VTEHAIVNASPIIYLSRSGHLDLLRHAASRVVVPDAVVREIERRGAADPTVRALAANRDWLEVVSVPALPPSLLAWDLGAGETSVLAWAVERAGSVAVVDDLAARRCAKVLGIPLLGTLGLVLRAKRRGDVTHARPIVLRLRETGMYLSESVLDAALALVGE